MLRFWWWYSKWKWACIKILGSERGITPCLLCSRKCGRSQCQGRSALLLAAHLHPHTTHVYCTNIYTVWSTHKYVHNVFFLLQSIHKDHHHNTIIYLLLSRSSGWYWGSEVQYGRAIYGIRSAMWQSKKLNMAEHGIAIYGRGSAIWLTKKFTIAEQVYVAKEVQNGSVKV